ncbi:four-carbon acid sugar kinase family protein [Lichenihabitans psoromatis]|uniref:four-carbon acid sugar kinase family protein n=1 Tax=Lichenihabitans psoromatis TaxID=2528642 RepID=UPI0010383F2E|nr:four-carbon acid sugar kinase family protein [Lichenihabitans psoromatis]
MLDPHAPLLAFYGDDLTGSTDAMEALAQHGVPTVLFMQQPTVEQRARFSEARAIGLAGTSRSETPDWMQRHLTPAFAWLHGLGAEICHYKVCSTFDSSPEIGSIGCAIEIGAEIFGQANVPLVIGAPELKRYTAFGTLFAAYQGATYRIDRHPVMSRHPVTPMHEADLRLHLARQTERRIALVDLAMLAAEDRSARVDALLDAGDGVVMFDVADARTQAAVGQELWRLRRKASFVVGSSGVEYALLGAWRAAGLIGGSMAFPHPGRAERIAVVSGSCSPTTARQISHAVDHGFIGLHIDAQSLSGPDRETAIANAIDRGLAVLQTGRSVILYTALGPESDLGASLDPAQGGRHAIGVALGRILRRLVEAETLTRAVIAGGDTSSHALRELDVFALETKLPLPQTPGSPLCKAFSDQAAFDGLEIALKGGQVGNDDYFCLIREGGASAPTP